MSVFNEHPWVSKQLTHPTLTAEHPVPPDATAREVVAYVTYLNTYQFNTWWGSVSHKADEDHLRRYIVRADRNLRNMGIWP